MKLLEKLSLNFNTLFSKTLAFSYLIFHYWYSMARPSLQQEMWADFGVFLFFGFAFFVLSIISILVSFYYLADKPNKQNYFSLFLSFLPLFFLYSFLYFPYDKLAEIIRLW